MFHVFYFKVFIDVAKSAGELHAVTSGHVPLAPSSGPMRNSMCGRFDNYSAEIHCLK